MDFLKENNWLWLLPAVSGVIAVSLSSYTTSACTLIQFKPLNGTSNDLSSFFIQNITNPVTNEMFSIEIAPARTLRYGPLRQTQFDLTYIMLDGTSFEPFERELYPDRTQRQGSASGRITADTNNAESSIPLINGSSSSENRVVSVIQLNFRDECGAIPRRITHLDIAWKYCRTIGVVILVFGSGCVLMFILVQPFYPYLKLQDYRLIACLFVLFGILQSTLVLLYTKSIACNHYPPLLHQMEQAFINSLQLLQRKFPGQGNITVGDNNLGLIWFDLIKSTYPEKCDWDVGSTLNIVAVFFWVLTAALMALQGPQQFRKDPYPVIVSGR